ncbi:MAG: pyridoxal phosphate-dependent aminotransferase [Oscillospiraceae bacterium]|nr:pyridoxal phosphate-dependent aminotransferase [Oscillospiraceae bacterium]MBQ6428756.1 pyridoxal phosphate-dependent aminotransferase [Oscillospiraceae bacterium]
MFSQMAYAMGAAPNEIRQIFEYGRQQAKLLGEDKVYDFSLGNPSIPAPAKVNETICRLLETESSIRIHGYTSGAGSDLLRAAVAKNLTERFGVKAGPENLFITCGAAPALLAVLIALRTEKSEIIAVAPYFMEYKTFTEASGSKFVLVPADLEAFQVNMSALAEAINENTQAVILNSPNNPSGAILTEETLRAVAALLTERSKTYGHPIYLVADEPYRELVYDGAKVTFIPTVYPDTIVCYSWSKSLSLPGERVGYIFVPPEATDSKDLYLAVAGGARACGHVCAPSLIQRTVAECIDCMPDLEAYQVNRKLLYEGLTEIGYECVKPDGAFYLFVKTPGGDNKVFCEKAKAKNLLVVPSEPFGVEGYFRLGYCVSKEMIERALPVFREVFEEM